jgi:glycerol-1-phosphate dehydrogenase [NAD(P)+]
MKKNNEMQAYLDLAVDTGCLETGSGELERSGGHFRRCFPGKSAFLIADENTFEAAGRVVLSAFHAAGIKTCGHLVFPSKPYLFADTKYSETLVPQILSGDEIPVAVGSGTINDIVKLASFRAGRPYMVVATACSVDGYTASGAAMQENGFKRTIYCNAPAAVIADIDVLRAAPYKMTAAGYADLYSKITAGADWIIADELGVEPIEPEAWGMVQDNLKKWVGNPIGLKDGNTEIFKWIFEGLCISGFAMQHLRNSRPASGTEHHIAHVLEMEHLKKDGEPVSHGFKVGIGTIAATCFMKSFFSRDPASIDIETVLSRWPDWERREEEIRIIFGDTPGLEGCIQASREKYLTKDGLSVRLHDIKKSWDSLTYKVNGQIYPAEKTVEMFRQADCPVSPEEIGTSFEHLKETILKAHLLRNRYTVLDLAYETGLLDECVDESVKNYEELL